MEPDLDRLLDFESHGGLFPQFRDSWERSYAAAQAFAEAIRGEGSGRSRVALQVVAPDLFCALFLALAREPVDLYFFSPTWGRSETEAAMRLARPRYFVYGVSAGAIEYKRDASAELEDAPAPGRNPLRVMIPTGGSSGRIRFAIHDWSSLAAATHGFQQHMDCDRLSAHCVLPLYHVSGFMQLARAILSMGSVVFGRLDGFEENHRLLMERGARNRFLSLVPTQLERLLRDDGAVARLLDYQAVLVGGGPAPVGLLERGRELRLPLSPTYGMTETAAQVATLLPEQFLQGERGQGRALPHVRIDIVAEEDFARPLPADEVGRIRVWGRSLFAGYVGERRKERELSIVTSDLGRLDARGFLTVLGRADRVVITGGEKVNPREVEVALEASGLLRDVVVFGLADREWGERLVVAYEPLEEWVGEGALGELLREDLAPFKIPKIWIRLKEIPRNAAGKAIVSELQSMAARQAAKRSER